MNTDAQTVDDTDDDLDTELGADDNAPQSIQDLLNQKNELKVAAAESINKLIGKQKFNRRDIVRSFAKMREYLEFVDSFQELILNDLQIIDGRFRRDEENLFKVSQQQTILTTALKDSKAVTDEQLVEAWEKKVKPELEAKVAEMQNAAAQTDAGQAPIPQEVPEQVTAPTTTATE